MSSTSSLLIKTKGEAAAGLEGPGEAGGGGRGPLRSAGGVDGPGAVARPSTADIDITALAAVSMAPQAASAKMPAHQTQAPSVL